MKSFFFLYTFSTKKNCEIVSIVSPDFEVTTTPVTLRSNLFTNPDIDS